MSPSQPTRWDDGGADGSNDAAGNRVSAREFERTAGGGRRQGGCDPPRR